MALEISHLVVNGCSFTYCQGLYDPPTEGWPKLLADKLGIPVVNLAVWGSGNDGIHRRTYDYFYKNLSTGSKPFYVIAMSQNTRREEYIIENEYGPVQDYINVSAHDHMLLSKQLYKNMDELGICLMEVRKLMQWQSMINLFEANNIPYVTSDYIPEYDEEVVRFIKHNHAELDYSVRTNPKTLKNFVDITRGYPKALDNGHDGKEAQVVLADFIYNQIIKRYGEIVPVKSDYVSLKTFQTQFKRIFIRNQWYRYEMGLPREYGINK